MCFPGPSLTYCPLTDLLKYIGVCPAGRSELKHEDISGTKMVKLGVSWQKIQLIQVRNYPTEMLCSYLMAVDADGDLMQP